MLNKEVKYGLKDIAIVPAAISNINSRSKCNPYDSSGFLPLFTAPMSSVVDLNNYKLFIENKIAPIIPRNIDLETRKEMCSETWCAFSMKEFYDEFENTLEPILINKYVLIDIANGGMKILHDSIRFAKEIHGDKLIIMAGNVANPETYIVLCEAGVNYCRIGVGNGGGCLTSSNLGVNFPSASLISECYEASLQLKNPAYIVADGGIKGYSDIIKCLALGADFVQVGSVFNKMLESSGETKVSNSILNLYGQLSKISCGNIIVDQYSNDILKCFKDGIGYTKAFYGMSTKKAQKELGNAKLKTSEGIELCNEVEYTMSQWTENFTDYLKSAMSYTNSKTLDDFIGEVQTIVISQTAQDAINK